MASEQEKAAAAPEETVEELSLLDQIVDEGRFGDAPAAQERGRGLVKQFVSQVLEGSIAIGEDTEAMLNARIAEIDRIVSLQLNEVMHADEFQKLEASWRGLHYLLAQSETSDQLRIKVLNVPKKELLRDLTKGAAAIEFDQSQLFKKVYEEEFGVLGGAPFGALIGDYYFGRSGQDIELLDKISKVAAAAHAPFLTAASADMLNLESFADLAAPRDLAKVFDTTEYAKWKQFRDSEDSRYVALTLPHILLREPYGAATVPIRGRGWQGPRQVPVGQRGMGAGDPRDSGLCAARLVRHDSRCGERGPGPGPTGSQLPDRFRRSGHEVPHGDADHRSAGEGAGGSRLRPADPPEEHGRRGFPERAVRSEGEGVQQAGSHGERPDFGAVALHLLGVPIRALPQVDDAGQARRLHVAERSGIVP
jgi:hypothetical protein